MLGGGGSILTVPALVYIVGQSPQTAVTASLAIVGANSLLGASFHLSQGSLRWRLALVFGGVGMIAAYLTAGLSHLFPQTLLMVLFAVLMLAVGGLMLVQRKTTRGESIEPRWSVVLASGAGVGAVTGFLGVGGGFLIVPALVMLIGLPMKEAVGTSLVIIAMNSVAGLLGHLGNTPLDLALVALIAIFIAAGLAGTFVGARLAHRLPAAQLRIAFGVFVIILAALLLVDNLPRLIG
ncbi:MAG: sulfite exporter TauE/SafE family protein [Anaerolineae bacterium]|nr:sulfite exporter TauE/SafE family protein [Anaerolineae bacterium]